MDERFTTLRCPFCGGVSHPATGCVYTPTFVACWDCTLEFARWLQTWTNKPGSKKNGSICFFDHVGKPNS